MGQSEADGRFTAASQLYVDGMYEDALVILTELDAEYPGELNLLKAKARTLAKLGRYQEAIEVCDRLETELGYEKADTFRRTLVPKLRKQKASLDLSFNPATTGSDGDAVEMEEIRADGKAASGKRRFRIKPVRLGALLLVLAGMYFEYVPYWLGGGLIVAYFAIKYIIAKLFVWLFSLPFKMKGKALAGATAELHGYEWTGKPESDSQDDDDEPVPAQPLRYAWLDVTITPPVRSKGFTHWEPGELMIAPAAVRIRNLDDMEKCFRIHNIKYIVDGEAINDEGNKVNGPQRLKLLAEFPEKTSALKFVYYGYCFGDIALAQS